MALVRELSVAHVSLARGYKGNERQTELLIKELAGFGVPQYLVCRDDSPLPFHLEGVKGLTIQRISGMSDPRFIGHFKLGKRCAILQAHENYAMQWCLVHYLIFGTPYVITRRKADKFDEGFINRAVYRSAARVVAISRFIQFSLQEAARRRVHLICDCSAHLEANPQTVHCFREALKNRFVVGNVGALINRQKGQKTLIEAAKMLRNSIPELVVIFVGAGDDLKLLKQLADGMPNIKFVGFKRNIVDYIASFDVFAYPVNQEGLGSIILDVMEQGVPVVASAVDGIPDVVRDGETGLLVQPGDAERLAHNILRLRKDRTFYNYLSNNGREEAERHSSSAMAADYYRLYTSVLNGEDEAPLTEEEIKQAQAQAKARAKENKTKGLQPIPSPTPAQPEEPKEQKPDLEDKNSDFQGW